MDKKCHVMHANFNAHKRYTGIIDNKNPVVVVLVAVLELHRCLNVIPTLVSVNVDHRWIILCTAEFRYSFFIYFFFLFLHCFPSCAKQTFAAASKCNNRNTESFIRFNSSNLFVLYDDAPSCDFKFHTECMLC